MHKYLLPVALLYTGLITWLSLGKIIIPGNIAVQGSDKIGHLLAYFVFTIIWFLFFFYSERQKRRFFESLWISSLAGFLYGILMEFCQAIFTDYRSPDWYDFIANTSGIILSVCVLSVLQKKLVKKRRY
ncbi:VanZ family protein [Aquimarina addita]|uniref:VanZ family protein n=1 Tax=Aquimarina addita TaxID=870485 RepID=UPI0031EF793B